MLVLLFLLLCCAMWMKWKQKQNKQKQQKRSTQRTGLSSASYWKTKQEWHHQFCRFNFQCLISGTQFPLSAQPFTQHASQTDPQVWKWLQLPKLKKKNWAMMWMWMKCWEQRYLFECNVNHKWYNCVVIFCVHLAVFHFVMW